MISFSSKILRIKHWRIGLKIKGAFFVLVLITLSTGVFSIVTLKNALKSLESINQELNPVIDHLTSFKDMIRDTRTFSTNWVYVPNYASDKEDLSAIHQESYPALRSELNGVEGFIEDEELKQLFAQTLEQSEQLLAVQAELMQSLQSFENYEDAFVKFLAEDQVENEIIPKSDTVDDNLNRIIIYLQNKSAGLTVEMRDAFALLQRTVWVSGLLGILFAVVISFWLSNLITTPLQRVLDNITRLSLGVIPEKTRVSSSDETGQITERLNKLIESFKQTADFADQIKSGDLDTAYQTLSDQDVLGQSLISMKENLKAALNETNAVALAVAEKGDLDQKLETANKEGAWFQLATSINDVLASILTPLRSIMSLLEELSHGDLTVRYEDEARGDIKKLTDSLNFALNNLNGLFSRIAQTTNTIDEATSEMLISGHEMNASTQEIAGAVAQISKGAHEQVSRVDESAKLVENILVSSREMSDRSQSINQAARKGVEDSEQGYQMIEKVELAMQEVNTFSDETNASMKVLLQRSNEIKQVLSVIGEIAAQTNLLALNAAIEAAQAGDAGRGFAVVAEEVRKLAEDSKQSANTIEKLIADVDEDTNKAASLMQQMNESISLGVDSSQEASAVFSEISTSSAQTLKYSEDILNSSQTQVEKIGEIVNITENIAIISEQTSAGTEEAASSASELSAGMNTYINESQTLNEISKKLKGDISQFQLNKQPHEKQVYE